MTDKEKQFMEWLENEYCFHKYTAKEDYCDYSAGMANEAKNALEKFKQIFEVK